PLLIPHLTFFLFITPRPPTSTLFPYTTLFRSRDGALDESEDAVEVDGHGLPPLLGRHFINGRVVGRPDAVVGHENIKPAEAGDGGLHQFLGIFGARKLLLDGEATSLATAILDDLLGFFPGFL